MLHQIRKMIGLIIAISRGRVKEDIFTKAFSLEKVNIPRAPGLGLMLEFVHYDLYNSRFGDDGMHDKLLWEKEEQKINDFAENYIFPTIINTEVNEKPMLTWLEKFDRHEFDSTQEGKEEEDDEGEECRDEDETHSDLKAQSSVQ